MIEKDTINGCSNLVLLYLICGTKFFKWAAAGLCVSDVASAASTSRRAVRVSLSMCVCLYICIYLY